MAIRTNEQMEMDVLEVDTTPPTDESVLTEKVEQEEQAFDKMVEAVSPEGEYSEGALTTITTSINDVLSLFGPMAEPIVAEESEGFLPASITAAISMISLAAQDAGMEEFAIDPTTLTNDRALIEAAGKLNALASNQNFGMFLKTSPQSVGVEVAQAEPAMASPAMGQEEVDVDALFASRM
jgi:hypothetical protein